MSTCGGELSSNKFLAIAIVLLAVARTYAGAPTSVTLLTVPETSRVNTTAAVVPPPAPDLTVFQGKPVHGGHPHVGHAGVEGPSSKALEGGLTVCRRHENPFPPQSAKVTSQGLEDGRLIVDRQYGLS